MKYIIFALILLFGNRLSSQTVKLDPFIDKYVNPVDISSTGLDGDDRLFITEKRGIIQILNIGKNTKNNIPFLDIDARVNSQGNEQGLLGLCFHPEYKSNGYFYVNYIKSNGGSVISRFKVDASNSNIADPNSEKIIIEISQPRANHNAGDLNFGPDGFLYIGMGDGGGGGDPDNFSQNPKSLLGKMLRLDVNTENAAYLIPNDNPFVNTTDTLKEIWSIGFRNPWRFSFDSKTGDMWIADVGQDEWEEINLEPKNKAKRNYGWRCYEGFETFNTKDCKDSSKYIKPIFAYRNAFNVGKSITGGYVYRGSEFSSLEGKYIYADYETGKIWALTDNGNGIWTNTEFIKSAGSFYSTFGTDNSGEIYVAEYTKGIINKITSQTSSSIDLEIANATINIRYAAEYDQLNIEYTSSNIGIENLQIIDINGNVVLNKVFQKNTIKTEIIQSLFHFQNGIYFVRVGNIESPIKKFAKY